MSVTLKQLEALVWVADLGSFKGAAERLNTTQPNISARIAAIEGLIGQAVFDRASGGVTPKGAELVEAARDVLCSRDAFLTVADEKALTTGRLRLGVTEMIVHTWLRDFMQALKLTYPQIVVELTVDMASELERLLAGHQLDLAFMNGPFQHLAEGVPLGSYDLAWVAAPDLGLSGQVTQDDLLAHPILTHARGTWPYHAVADHLQKGRAQLVPSSNLSVCLQMAMDGMGIAMLPAAMARAEVAAGQLVVLDYPWAPDPMVFEARYDQRRSASYIAEVAALAVQVSDH